MKARLVFQSFSKSERERERVLTSWWRYRFLALVVDMYIHILFLTFLWAMLYIGLHGNTIWRVFQAQKVLADTKQWELYSLWPFYTMHTIHFNFRRRKPFVLCDFSVLRYFISFRLKPLAISYLMDKQFATHAFMHACIANKTRASYSLGIRPKIHAMVGNWGRMAKKKIERG